MVITQTRPPVAPTRGSRPDFAYAAFWLLRIGAVALAFLATAYRPAAGGRRPNVADPTN